MSTTESTRPTGRHPVNVGHLVMGIAFLGLVGIWALIVGDVVASEDVRWLLPVPWVLAGLAGLLAIGLSGSRRWSTRQTGWVEPRQDASGPYGPGWTQQGWVEPPSRAEAPPASGPTPETTDDEENR
jgi:hypothetical protein